MEHQPPLDRDNAAGPGASPSQDPAPTAATAAVQAFLRSGRCRGADGLDDYQDDFRSFAPLGPVETAHARHQRERRMAAGQGDDEDNDRQVNDDATRPGSPIRPSGDTGRADTAHALHLSAERCPHRHARREGCRRCIERCPTGAIRAGDPVPRIDPAVCDACGLCAAACPTGALQWISSTAGDIRRRLHGELGRAGCPAAPWVIFHDGGVAPAPAVAASGSALVVTVPAIGLIGMDVALAALAWGAAGVWIGTGPAGDDGRRGLPDDEIRWSRALLAALGHSPDRIGAGPLPEAGIAPIRRPENSGLAPADFGWEHSKRALVRLAAGHLARSGRTPSACVALPDRAPFGAVHVDASRCTLCMACAGACKTHALRPQGGDAPGLQFTEIDCVQCGLCAMVCPEQAVELIPRLNLDTDQASSAVPLLQADPARCICCGRPFAAQRMIATIVRKLQGHWMYEDDQAQKRLRMCDRCRVQDIFVNPSAKRPAP